MKAQHSQDFTDDVALPDEEVDDLEAWTPQDLDQIRSFGVSPTADLAD
jgi:hypothetical protein